MIFPKRFVLVSGILFFCSFIAVHATTHVSGLISTNTTWDIAGSPYWVDSDITVDTGVTLTIEPGVVVKMEYDHTLYSGGYQYTTRFIVNGILDAQGEPGNLIYFTSIRDDTVAGDTNGDGGATTPADGDWAYIQLHDSASVLDHCEIRYGGLRDDDPSAYETWHNYSVWCYQSAPAITNSMIRDSNISFGGSPYITVLYDTVSENVTFTDNTIYDGGNGLYYIESTGIWPPLEPEIAGNLLSGCLETALYCAPISYNGLIQSNDIQDGGTAIYVNAAYPGTGYGAPPVINNDIESAIEGISILNGGASLVWDNTISETSLGISMVDSECLVYDNTITGGSSYPLRQVETTFPVYSGNTITGNARQGVQVFGTIAGSGTWDMATGLPYVVTTDLVIAPGHTLTVLPGTVVKMDYNHMLYSGGYQFTTRIVAEGVLDARGTEADPIWFTSIRNDTVAGDTNGDGGATTPADGDWGYIRLDDSAGVLDHCIIQYGGLRDDDPGTDELWHSYGIWCFESAPQITHCRISDMNISYGLEPYISVYYENTMDPAIFRDNTILEGGHGLYYEEEIGLWPPLFSEVAGNYLSDCDGWGMYLYGISSWADLRENMVDACDGGMFLLDPTGVLGIPDVIGNTVLSSGNGIMIQNGGQAAVYQNTVSQCFAGIMLTDSDCMIEDNILTDNTGFPIWQMADSQPTYAGNTISGNFNRGILVGGVISSDTHWEDVQNLGLPYAVMSIITVNPGARLTLDPGIVIKFDYDHSMYSGGYQYTKGMDVQGVLNAQGTDAAPIVFTSIRDDSVAGDTNGDGGATVPMDGDWAYVKLSSSESILEYCEVRYAGLRDDDPGSAETWHDYALWCSGCSPTITHCRILDTNVSFGGSPQIAVYFDTVTEPVVFKYNTIQGCEYGVFYTETSAGNSALTQNSIADAFTAVYAVPDGTAGIPAFDDTLFINISGWAVYNTTAVCISAESCWWDDAGGPYDPSNAGEPAPCGLFNDNPAGAVVTDYVDYSPWIGTTPPTATPSATPVPSNTPAPSSTPTHTPTHTPTSAPATQTPTQGPPTVTPTLPPTHTPLQTPVAGTHISGAWCEDLHWIQAESPYIIDSDFTLCDTATLTIDPGVVIKLEYDHSTYSGGYQYTTRFIIEGVMIAEGTEEEPIIFTSIRDDSVAGDSNGDGPLTAPADGDWAYIRLYSSDSVMTWCEVRYGGLRDDDPSTSEAWRNYSVWCDHCAPEITNCRFEASNVSYGGTGYTTVYYDEPSDAVLFSENIVAGGGTGLMLLVAADAGCSVSGNTFTGCDGHGIYATGLTSLSSISGNLIEGCTGGADIEGAPEVSGNDLYDCDIGLGLTHGDGAPVTGNTVAGCGSGIILIDGSNLLTDNLVIDNAGYPFTQIGNTFPVYQGNTWSGNRYPGIMVYGVINGAGTWVDIQGEGIPYIIDGTLLIEAGAQLQIQPGCIVKFIYDHTTYSGGYQYTSCLVADGDLIAEGTSQAPILFTSNRDDTGGDTNCDGPLTVPEGGDWGYIKLSTSTSSMEYCHVRYGGLRDDDAGTGETWRNYMVWCPQSAPAITHCMFTDSNTAYGGSERCGVYYDQVLSEPVCHDNTFLRNDFGQVYTENTGSLLNTVLFGNTYAENNYGLFLLPKSSSGLSMDGNDFYDNDTIAVQNASTICVSAKECWWGSSNGPHDVSSLGNPSCLLFNDNPPGQPVSDNVVYTNWVTVPPPTFTPTPLPSATPTPVMTPTPTPPCYHHGDVNFSGGLTAADAQTIFYIVLGMVTPTYEEACAADCNGSGSITAGDSQDVFYAVIGMGAGCVDPL